MAKIKYIISIVCMLFLCSCVDVKQVLELNEDGSGKMNIQYVLSPEAVKMLTISNDPEQYEKLPVKMLALKESDATAIYQPYGLEIADFSSKKSDNGSVTITYNIPFKDIGKFANQSQAFFGVQLVKVNDTSSKLSAYNPSVIKVFQYISNEALDNKENPELGFLVKNASWQFDLKTAINVTASNSEGNKWSWDVDEQLKKENHHKHLMIPQVTLAKAFETSGQKIQYRLPELADFKLNIKRAMERSSARIRGDNADQSKQIYFAAELSFPSDVFPVYYQRPSVKKIKVGDQFQEVRAFNFARWEKNRNEEKLDLYVSMGRATQDLATIKAMQGGMKIRCAEFLNRYTLDKALEWTNKTISTEPLSNFRMQINHNEGVVRIYARNNSHLIKSLIFLSGDGNIIPEYKDPSNKHHVKLDENSKMLFEFFEKEKEVELTFEETLNK